MENVEEEEEEEDTSVGIDAQLSFRSVMSVDINIKLRIILC